MSNPPIDKSFTGRLRDMERRITELDRRLAQSRPPAFQLPDRLAGDAVDLGTRNLNTVQESGWFVQTANAQATAARNYPAQRAGLLQVIASTAGSDFVLQRYTDYQFANGLGERYDWVRNYYAGDWSPWRPDGELPAPKVDFASDVSEVTQAAEAWSNATGSAAISFGTLPRALVVRLDYSGIARTTTGASYVMIGAHCSGGLTLSPEVDQASGTTQWGITPFSNVPAVGTTAYSVPLYGTKTVTLPAGSSTSIRLRTRRSVATGSQVLAYGKLEATPLKWV